MDLSTNKSLKEDVARRRQALSSSKQALLATRLRSNATVADEPHAVIPRRPDDVPTQASFAQQRIWFLQQLEPESPAYNEHITIRMRGSLDQEVLIRTLWEMMSRHETLRSHFIIVDGQVRQVISTEIELPWSVVDVREVAPDEREAAVSKRILVEHQRLFELSQGMLWRATLFQLAHNEHVLLIIMHHSICDAWSMELFHRELFRIYEAFHAGKCSPFAPLTVQYADFAYWHQRWLEENGRLQQQLVYWEKQLGGTLPMLELPSVHSHLPMQTYNGHRHPLVIPQSLYQELLTFSRQEGVTLFMLLLSAFTLVLHLYTHQKDIIVGTLIAGRTYPELESIIGCFANALALRIDLGNNPTNRELLRRVRAVALDAYANQDVPFEKLVEHLQPERSTSSTPIFQTMFILQNVPSLTPRLEDLELAPFPELENSTAKFNVTVNLQESTQGVSGYLEYNTDLFEDALMERMAEHLLQALRAMIAQPQQHIASVPLLIREERHLLLEAWNHSAYTSHDVKCFSLLFEEQVERTPDLPAVVYEDGYLSYAELNRRANKIAHYLGSVGIGAEDLVALLDERGWPLLVAMLAVFKIGAAYLPLDPHHPPARLCQILENSGCSYVLTARKFVAKFEVDAPIVLHRRIQCHEDILLLSYPEHNLEVELDVKQLAYVIYTSGSTGKQKGVMVEQRGMVNHLYSKISDLQLTAEDVVAQTASQCFDISVWQFLSPLIIGAYVHIFSDAAVHDPFQLFSEVDRHGVTILEMVPSLLHIAVDELQKREEEYYPLLSSLRWLLMTGEALPPELCRSWLHLYPGIPMLNAYGPTECSDDITTAVIATPPAAAVMHTPIGDPIANMRLYVLNSAMELVPPGVIGELYAGGVGVGRGYLADAARTAAYFVPDPFSGVSGARLYKTGDKVRWLADGMLEYLGRLDSQVKVRGYRIEMGEIEAVLARHPAVWQCVVLVQGDVSHEKHLVAYVVSTAAQKLDIGHLRQFLRECLPEYMVPTVFIVLSEFPLNENGKIDRRALPAEPLQQVDAHEDQLRLPRSPLEEILAVIWARMLGIQQVSIDDSFFELGGHSLLATSLMASIQETFDVEFPLHWLFEQPTVAGLADLITQRCAEYEKVVKIAELWLIVSRLSEDEVAKQLNSG